MKFETTSLEVLRKVKNRIIREELVSLYFYKQQFNYNLHRVVFEERKQELKMWLDMSLKFREIFGSFIYSLKEKKLEVKEIPLPTVLQDRINEIDEK